MKFILILILSLTYIHADEIQRIESIVKDIKKLRVDYEKSQDELALYKVKLRDEQQKNTILLKELKIEQNSVEKLQNQIKSKNNNVIIKEVVIEKEVQSSKICQKNQTNIENKFPKLKMKKEFVAGTFRFAKDADVYDGVDGNVVAIWEEKTSFTSNVSSGDWTKITGYFVNKKWQKATEELWVRTKNTIQREKK